MSSPRVRVSRSALERNISRALGADPRAAIDLRRDACGYGAATVARAAQHAGMTAARTDEGADAHGLAPARGSVLPLEDVFGLDGRGEPAMTLLAPVLQTKQLRAGDGVSYGYLHRAERDTRVALVSGGYAQGVARAIGSHTSVIIDGIAHPIIGRVAMDVCVVDVGTAEVVPRQDAVFFGPSAPHLLGEWARATGWTQLELAAVAGASAEREETA